MAPGFDLAAQANMNDAGRNALIAALLGLFCCGPVSIYGFIKANEVVRTSAMAGVPAPSSATAARVIAIIAMVLWALSLVLRVAGAAGSHY
jgi:hypothetical protein